MNKCRKGHKLTRNNRASDGRCLTCKRLRGRQDMRLYRRKKRAWSNRLSNLELLVVMHNPAFAQWREQKLQLASGRLMHRVKMLRASAKTVDDRFTAVGRKGVKVQRQGRGRVDDFVALYECPGPSTANPQTVKLMARACAANRTRARAAQKDKSFDAAAKRAVKGRPGLAAMLLGLDRCLECPGVIALAEMGKIPPPNELHVEIDLDEEAAA